MSRTTLFFLVLSVFSLVNAFFLPYSSMPVLSATLVVIGGLLTWCGLCFLQTEGSKLLWIYALVLPLSVVLSINGAISHHLALLNFFRLFALLGVFVGSVVVCRKPLGKKYIQYFLYSFFVLCCATGIYEMLFPVEMPLHWAGVEQAGILPFRVSSFFINPNLWGAFAAIMSATLATALLVEPNGESSKKIGALLFLFAANLGGTFSRGAWLSMIIGLLLTCGLVWIKKVYCSGKKNSIRFLLFGVIPLLLILYPSLSSRLSTLAKPGEFGMKQRILLYKGIGAHVVDNLPLGSGAGSFQTLFPKYRLVGGQYVYEAHSDFLQFFAEAGFPGFAGLIIFFCAILLFCAKRVNRASDCLIAFAFFITFAVAGNTVSFFHYSFLIVPILITGGVLLGNTSFCDGTKGNGDLHQSAADSNEPHQSADDSNEPLKSVRNENILRLTIFLLSVSGIFYWGCMFISERIKSQALIAGRGGADVGLALDTLEKASKFSPLRSDLYYLRGLYKINLVRAHSKQLASMSEATSNSKTILIASLKAEYELGLKLFNEAIVLNRGESIYRQAKSELHLAAKAFDKSLTSINDALIFDPCSVRMAYEKANILDEMGQTETAIKFLKLALESNKSFIAINKTAYRPVVLKLTELFIKTGRVTEAREIQEKYGNLLGLKRRSAINDR